METITWQQIRSLRESLGILQTEMAEALQLPVSRYNLMERSEFQVDLKIAALKLLQERQEEQNRRLQRKETP